MAYWMHANKTVTGELSKLPADASPPTGVRFGLIGRPTGINELVEDIRLAGSGTGYMAAVDDIMDALQADDIDEQTQKDVLAIAFQIKDGIIRV